MQSAGGTQLPGSSGGLILLIDSGTWVKIAGRPRSSETVDRSAPHVASPDGGLKVVRPLVWWQTMGDTCPFMT